MAWNQPGGTGGKDPWGPRKGDQGPPDLDQLLRNIQQKLGGLFGGGGSPGNGPGRLGIGLIGGVIIVLWLLSGFYIVQQNERAVILQFGKFKQTAEPGLHWRIPFPVQRVEKVDVGQVHILRVGYSGERAKGARDALMLTEDENIIHIEFAVQYRLKDAAMYLFNVRDPEKTIQQATESAVREIVGKSKLDFVLTEGRDVVAQQGQQLLQEILDRYESGIQIVTLQMQDARAPEEVQAAFEDAIKAREDAERKKNEAEAYSNDVIPRARGQAARMIQEAQGYRASVIARAEGDARRFTQVVAEYARAPGVTRDRLYIETMEQVLSRSTKILIDQKGGNSMIYLPLDKIMGATGHTAPVTGPVSTLPPLPEASDAPVSRDRGRERGVRP